MPRNPVRSSRPKSSRGRPRKVDTLRLIREQGVVLSEEFRLNPIRRPVDSPFLEYYERLLKGDAEAILAYVEANRKKPSLDASFYEVIGRLVFRRFFPGIHKILCQLERNPVFTRPNPREKYDHWYGVLKPLCDSARKFILRALETGDDPTVSRERLWGDYLSQYEGKISARATEELRAFADGDPDPPRCRIISHVNKFRRYGHVPKNVFFELAKTTYKDGRRIPQHSSKVARQFACKIVDISESTVSHWRLRKK